MRVRYNEYVANPTLRHTETNLPAHVAQSLIAQGVAVHVPYTSVRDRIESEAALLPKPAAPAVTWGIKESTGNYSCTTIVKCVGADTTYFKTPPPDCPPSIVARFKELTDGVAPTMSPDVAALHAAAHQVGDSNKHRPILKKYVDGKPVYVDPAEFVKRK